MSFPPPPPPYQQPRPPPPGDSDGYTSAQQHNDANALQSGMSNMRVSRAKPQAQPTGFPPRQQHPYQAAPSHGFQAPPPQQPASMNIPPSQAPQRFPPPPPVPRQTNQLQQQHSQRPPPPPSPYLQGPGVGMYTNQQQVREPPQNQHAPPPPPTPSRNHPFPAKPARPPPPPAPYSSAYNLGYPPPVSPRPPMPVPPPPHQRPGYEVQQPQSMYSSAMNGRYSPVPPPPSPGPRLPPGPPPSPGQPQNRVPGTPQQEQPKIDPAQIPRPPLFTRPNDNGPLPIYSPKAAASQTRIAPPPPADSRYLVHDDGNASPQLIRSNLYTIPSDRSTWQKVGEVDMGILCSPMALPSQDYVPTLGPQPNDVGNKQPAPLDAQRIPLVPPTTTSSGGLSAPPRCRSCNAYVNAYWEMDINTCNFCGVKNSNTDFDVICLQKGTVDYAVSGPYVTRHSPVQPVFLYALDLTCSHLEDYVDMLKQVGIDLGRHFQQQPAHQEMLQRHQQTEMSSHDDHAHGHHRLDPKTAALRQQRPRIGLCFVASFGIVVVARNGPQGSPLPSVMPDVTEDPFCHLPLTDWTFDLSTPEGLEQWSQHIQEDLLECDLLKNLKKDAGKKNAYGLDGYELSCGGAAMAFCADALAGSGGRATWISSRRPNFGVGSVRHRGISSQSRKPPTVEDATPLQRLPGKPSSGEDEKAGVFYRQLQDKCSQRRVILDIIIHSNPKHVPHQHLELSTQGEICRATCGKLTWISAPDIGWMEPLMEELRRPLLCFQGWDAVLKVRCSSGLQVKNFLSHPGTAMDGGGLATSPELELSCVTPQTSISVLLEHRIGGIPKNSAFVFVQSALLYSTLTGQRRVRVSTLALRPSAKVPEIFTAMDFPAFTTLYLRSAVSLLQDARNNKDNTDDLNTLQKQAREEILKRLVKLFVCYRQNTNAINSPRGQLILPEKLQLLPLFGMCLLKSTMLRPSLGLRVGPSVVVSPTSDERAHFAFQALMIGPASAFLLVHPNVYAVGKPLAEGTGQWRTPPGAESAFSELSKASYHSYIQLPPTVNASITCLEDDGVYLVDSGLAVYLFFGKDVPEDTKHGLHHLPSSPSLTTANATMTEYGQLIRRVVWQLRAFCEVGSDGSRSALRPTFVPVIPVYQGRPTHSLFEQDVMNCMVDDPNSGEKDYTDYLVKLHRLIREKMEPSKK